MLVAQGNLAEALKSYRGEPRHQRAAGQGRSRQCRLAARSLGVVQQGRRRAGGAGQSAGGAEGLPRRLAISERLAKADPGNAGWQRDLSVSYEQGRRRAGGAGQPAGGAAKPTATPRHRASGWPRPIPATPAGSAICRCRYNKVGDVLVAQGNLPEALNSFRDSLAIAERLAKSDPGNAGWQRDLSVSYIKVGDVLVAQGDLPEALKSYQRRVWPSGSGWPSPIPAMPAGSAICRFRTRNLPLPIGKPGRWRTRAKRSRPAVLSSLDWWPSIPIGWNGNRALNGLTSRSPGSKNDGEAMAQARWQFAALGQ